MIMKTILKLTATSLTIFLVVVLSGFSTSENNAALVIKDFGCNVMDGNGLIQTVDGTISVLTSNGTTTLVCRASDLDNDQGRTKVYRGLPCDTFQGNTNRSINVVSPRGNVTLTCTLTN